MALQPHQRAHRLRTAAHLFRLAALTYRGPVDHGFYRSLQGLAQAPGLQAKGLSPLEPHLAHGEPEQALVTLAAEYDRLFGAPDPICTDPRAAAAAFTALADALDAAAAVHSEPASDTAHAAHAADLHEHCRQQLTGFLDCVYRHACLALYRNVTRMTADLLADTSLDHAIVPEDTMLTIYSTSTCAYCRQLKTGLDRAGIAYTDINIETDPAAASYVESVNGGNQTVPTVVCPSGSVMTNPTLAEVKECLSVRA